MTAAFKKPIPLSLPLTPSPMKYAEIAAKAFNTGVLTNHGPLCEELEERLSERLAPLALCSNGTIAITLALRALKVKGEVITSAFTFPATIQAIELAGLTPVLADVDPDSMLITPHTVARKITAQTGAILPVHLFGRLCDTEGFAKLASERGLTLIYDGAHAFDLPVFGDATTYSFHATKLFHTAEGGAAAFPNSAEALASARRLRSFGMSGEVVVESGMNAKLSELHAALGLWTLCQVEEERRKRRAVAAAYISVLGGERGVEIITSPNCQYFVVRLTNPLRRDAVYSALMAHNVQSRRYFWPAIPAHPAYMARFFGDFPGARAAAKECLALPFYGALPPDDAQKIARIVLGKKP
ncbi:MAG: DegT/DnrJ/EryC1/StrS family aminotransferase [Christensenellales bacterium]|jgi:dTDP-4-amino-4,6-dideoxygalactose transaminase